jgi:splicing factor 3B subunit 1
MAAKQGSSVLFWIPNRTKRVPYRVQVGCTEIVGRIVEDLKDESEPYRRMVMETINKVVQQLGTADIDARLEELLIDGILYAFQEQVGLCLPACLPL